MRLAVPSARPSDAAPRGAWRRLAACLAAAALFAQTLAVQASLVLAGGDMGDMCSVMPAAAPDGDARGTAGGQPAAAHAHCPVCTAAPGSAALPPPAVALAPPPFWPLAEAVRAAGFDVVQPPYLDGPPGHAPPRSA